MSTLPIFQQTLGLLPYPLTQTSERVFRAYGGFSTRVGGLQRADVAEAFERRRSLIAATSLNAPVHRANLNTVSAAAVIAAIDRTPFVETVAPDPSETTSTLDEWLGRRVALSHERIRSEAWGWFQDAEYRRAARAFESAALLDPEDHASLVGELFSYVSLGAGHTAITTLKQLGRRLADPFALEIDITARFDRPERAGEIRVRMQPPAQDVDVSPELTALHAFVLWYLGDRDDALRIATGLARSHPMSEYASWPALMRGVMTAAAVPSESLD